jgi:hypothetical protein
MTFKYGIRIGERGRFNGHVEDEAGKTVLIVDVDVIIDANMREKKDLIRLKEYLLCLNTMKPGDNLVF